MDIHAARQELKKRSIYDIPLRATFYARVSSESDEQLNSLGNQVDYYRDLIRKNPAWTYVEGYIDEGLSAATTKNRENFHRMVADGRAGRFDLILTKEITRFARNTLDSIRYTRELLSAGVGVFFQNDGINTLDEDSELRLTIMSGIAQDELRKLSSRVKFGHQQAIKNSVVLGNSRIFGYRKDAGRLAVDQTEAPLVRELFELYATGEYSLKRLETLFWEQGWRNHNGGRIAHTTLSGILSNPKYKGYYVGNKVKVLDLFTKKQKFLPPEEWVMFRDDTGQIVPAIVSEEVWERANEVLRRRSDDVKRRRGVCNHDNLLTGKLYCGHCGAPYYRRDSVDRSGHRNSRWVCSGKLKNGAGACPSIPLYEAELRPVLADLFRTADAGALMDEYLALYRSLGRDEGLERQAAALRRTVETAERKRQKLLTYNALGQLSDGDFLAMSAQCGRELEDARRRLEDLTARMADGAAFPARLDAIRRTLEDARLDAAQGLPDRDFVERYIRRIDVFPEAGRGVRLEIRLRSGEAAETQLQAIRDHAGRTGHTFKKMIESYEKSL